MRGMDAFIVNIIQSGGWMGVRLTSLLYLLVGAVWTLVWMGWIGLLKLGLLRKMRNFAYFRIIARFYFW